MLTVYIICAVLGGGLIVLSLFGGDHGHGTDTHFGDHDIGHDIGHDVGHDLGHDVGHDVGHGHDSHGTFGHHGGPWIPFFSLRFWTYMVGVFGATGLILTQMNESVEPVRAWIAAGTGFASGLIAAAMVRWLQTHEADSTARDRDMLGLRARVTVPIRERQVGRIRATVKGELLDILATSEEPLALPEGSEVVIIGMEDGRATVMPLDVLLEEKA